MKIWWQSGTPLHRLHDYRTSLSAHLDIPFGDLGIDFTEVLKGFSDSNQMTETFIRSAAALRRREPR